MLNKSLLTLAMLTTFVAASEMEAFLRLAEITQNYLRNHRAKLMLQTQQPIN